MVLAVAIARADYPPLPPTRASEPVRALVRDHLLVTDQYARAKIGDVLCSEPVGQGRSTSDSLDHL